MSAATQAIAPPSFRNVLFMTDFSPCSAAAAPFARAIAQQFGSTIHAMHIVSPSPVVIGGEFGGAGIELERESEDTACLRMNQFLQSGAFNGALYTQTIQTGAFWHILMECISGLTIDLIVMGTHGRRGMQHLFLGSVAEEVFRRVTQPVLSVGPGVPDGGLASRNVHTILYATDFSPASLHALDYALYLCRAWNAHLLLLHSTERLGSETEAFSKAELRLRSLVASTGIEFNVVVGCRPAAEMILNTSRDVTADVIVMGAHTGSTSAAHVSWSVAHRVLCSAACPVLTVRTRQ